MNLINQVTLVWFVHTKRVQVIKLSFPDRTKSYFIKFWLKDKSNEHCWDNYDSEIAGLKLLPILFAPYAPQLSVPKLIVENSEHEYLVTAEAPGILLRNLILKSAWFYHIPNKLWVDIKKSLCQVADWITVLHSTESDTKQRYNFSKEYETLTIQINTCVKNKSISKELSDKIKIIFNYCTNNSIDTEYYGIATHNALGVHNILVNDNGITVIDFGQFTNSGDKYNDITKMFVHLGNYGQYGFGSIKRTNFFQEIFLNKLNLNGVTFDKNWMIFRSLLLQVDFLFSFTSKLKQENNYLKKIIRKYQIHLAQCYLINLIKQCSKLFGINLRK